MLGLVMTVLVLLGVVVAILLLERPRARRIERDLREQVVDRRESPGATEQSGRRDER